MTSVSVSVDVPDLAEAVRFYARAFGFSKSSEPVPGVVVLRVGGENKGESRGRVVIADTSTPRRLGG